MGRRQQMSSRDSDTNTISFKYTIDYPKIELHPFDTKKFTILYNDTDSQGGSVGIAQQPSGDSNFKTKLEVRTLSRESRDLISLTIKCFSAQSYFINSKIINLAEDHDLCKLISGNSKFPSKSGVISTSQLPAAVAGNLPIKKQQYVLSDVMLELEFVKHDLDNQLQNLKLAEAETKRFKQQFNDVEDEMQTTIASYKNIIENLQSGDSSSQGNLKVEIDKM